MTMHMEKPYLTTTGKKKGKATFRSADSDQFWYRNGHSHRDGDLPAAIWEDGEQRWYRNGVQYNPKETA